MIDLMAGEQKQDWFLKINPKHQVPALAIDDKTFISESVVICQYLCKVAGQNSLYPGLYKNTFSRIPYSGVHLSLETLHTPITHQLMSIRLGPNRDYNR